MNENWSEDLVRFLTDPTISSLLTTFGTIGIISELYSAGWGIGGTIGIVCLTLALGAGYLTQLASSLDLLIIMAGLLLLVVEFIAIPGFGFFGIAGIGVLFYGLYLLLIPDIPVSDEIYSQALDGFSWGIVGGIICLIMVINLLLKSKFLEKFIIQAQRGDLGTKDYNEFWNEFDFKVKVSFGMGTAAKIPWISFLAPSMSTSQGFYPVYLYYKEQDVLFLSFGISETHSFQGTFESKDSSVNLIFHFTALSLNLCLDISNNPKLLILPI